MRAGDPHLSVHFNLTQARILARANAIDQAWHYLDLAATLLTVEPSHVLEAQHAFTATLLSSSVCRYTEAVLHGRRALSEARTAGYGRLVPRIHANLALALVHLGHVGEAETLLDEALASASISAEARVAMMDTKAQILPAPARRARLPRPAVRHRGGVAVAGHRTHVGGTAAPGDRDAHVAVVG